MSLRICNEKWNIESAIQWLAKNYGYFRRWYEESANYEFEGHIFKGIKDYDEYLTFKFGEYMKLPPEEQRKTHPATYYKLLP